MRLSEKRQQDAYNAIAEPLIRSRIELEKYMAGRVRPEHAEAIDRELFNLQSRIWGELQKALRLPTPPDTGQK